MSILNGEVLLNYFPAALLVITLEIIMSIYKSSDYQWTAKLAIGNLFLNLTWIALIVVVTMDPKLFNPEFVRASVKNIYDSPTEKMSSIIQFILYSLVFSVIVTNAIDSYSGFVTVKADKNSASNLTERSPN